MLYDKTISRFSPSDQFSFIVPKKRTFAFASHSHDPHFLLAKTHQLINLTIVLVNLFQFNLDVISPIPKLHYHVAKSVLLSFDFN